jgi:hypothetical protein
VPALRPVVIIEGKNPDVAEVGVVDEETALWGVVGDNRDND